MNEGNAGSALKTGKRDFIPFHPIFYKHESLKWTTTTFIMIHTPSTHMFNESKMQTTQHRKLSRTINFEAKYW